ncbi:mobilization protein, partial [Klebsiella pneumoniae]|nr:mobilization protein [Klebsiella pneumoniae]
MAIARLSMKAGMKGRGADHSAYISREGKYANRLERGERLEATDHGNMPEWAK